MINYESQTCNSNDSQQKQAGIISLIITSAGKKRIMKLCNVQFEQWNNYWLERDQKQKIIFYTILFFYIEVTFCSQNNIEVSSQSF